MDMKEKKEFIEKEFQKFMESIKPIVLSDFKNLPEKVDIWRMTHHYIFTCNNCKKQLSFIEGKYDPLTLECSKCRYKIEIKTAPKGTPIY